MNPVDTGDGRTHIALGHRLDSDGAVPSNRTVLSMLSVTWVWLCVPDVAMAWRVLGPNFTGNQRSVRVDAAIA